MNVSIALSIGSILENILAYSALRYHLSAPRPTILVRDQTPALLRLITTHVTDIAAYCGAEVSMTDDDIAVITLALPPRTTSSTFRALIESAVTAGVTAELYSNCDSFLSAHYAERLSHMRRAILDAIAAPATISRFS